MIIRAMSSAEIPFLHLRIENFGCAGKEHQGLHDNEGRSTESDNSVDHNEYISFGSTTILDLLRPVCQQWHLLKLMTIVKRDASGNENNGSNSIMQVARPLQFLDIAYLYSNMIRIYSILNFKLGSLPVLNMLSFTPGFLVSLWAEIESSLLSKKIQAGKKHDIMQVLAMNCHYDLTGLRSRWEDFLKSWFSHAISYYFWCLLV